MEIDSNLLWVAWWSDLNEMNVYIGHLSAILIKLIGYKFN